MTNAASRDGYGSALIKLASDPKVVVVEADLGKSTKSQLFRKSHPDRTISLGISEQNMMLVSAGLANKCVIQLSYAIGVSEPLSIYVNTFGTNSVPEDRIERCIEKCMDLSPNGIIEHLDLLKPIYAKTSAYGHFGQEFTKDGHFSWEKTDLVGDLLKQIN